MTIATDDILRVKLKTTIQGQACLNVFHYHVEAIDVDVTTSEVLTAKAFADTVVPVIKAMTSSGLAFDEVYVENLSDTLRPFASYTLTGNGLIVDDANPSFTAIAIRQAVGSRKTRSGYKRFAGVPESVVTAGAFTATYVNAHQANASLYFGGSPLTLFSLSPSAADVLTVRNIVLKSIHALPVIDIDWQFVTSAILLNRPTTQNTRKLLGT